MRVETLPFVFVLILLFAPLAFAAEPPTAEPLPEVEPIELQEEAETEPSPAEPSSAEGESAPEAQLNLFGQDPFPALGGPGCMCTTWEDCIPGCTPPTPGYPPKEQWCQFVSPGCGICWC